MKISNCRRRHAIFGFTVTIPALITLIALFIYPLIFSIYVSLTNYNMSAALGNKKISFVGFDNYIRVLKDHIFQNAILVTITLTVMAIVLEFSIALLLAVAVSKIQKSKSIFITIFLITLMIAPVVVALLFKFILNDEMGVLNAMLRQLGIIHADIPWLSHKYLAKLSVVLIDTWQATSAVFLLLYTGIIGIPKELFESAIVDGANKWRVFYNIILPMIKDVIVYSMVIRFMDLFRIFDSIYLLTNGGPANATESVAMYIYRRSWTEMDVSKASAASHIMMLVMIIGILCIKRLGNRERRAKG